MRAKKNKKNVAYLKPENNHVGQIYAKSIHSAASAEVLKLMTDGNK